MADDPDYQYRSSRDTDPHRPVAMEALSDILRAMRVEGSVYFCDHVAAPWQLDFQDTVSASFHLVRRGECWVMSGETVDRLGPGDLVFVEPGRDHALASQPPGKPPPVDGAQTLLLCGYCDFTRDMASPLLDVFPSLSIVREEDMHRHRFLKTTLDQLSAEYQGAEPGAELIVNKLTEIVLVELIRISFGRGTHEGFVQALFDRPIAAALGHLHGQPERSWTLGNLAREVGMSRSAFAKRFRELVGQPMFEYLTALRMQHARALLRDTRLPLFAVAERVGYTSDLAFAKTFKKTTGTTPTRYRKAQEAAT